MNVIAEQPAAPRVIRASGRLEDLVREVCDSIVLGADDTVDIRWTPHRVAKLIEERYPESGAKPSAGAITAAFLRWREVGFAEIGDKPVEFLGYTVAGRAKGLSALKAERRTRLNDERAATATPKKSKSKSKAKVEGVQLTLLPDADADDED